MNYSAGFARTSEPVPAAAPAASHASAPSHAEVLRTVAHELRQPLSSIENIAFYLSLLLPPHDEKIQAQLQQIRCLVEQSNRIVSGALDQALQVECENLNAA